MFETKKKKFQENAYITSTLKESQGLKQSLKKQQKDILKNGIFLPLFNKQKNAQKLSVFYIKIKILFQVITCFD